MPDEFPNREDVQEALTRAPWRTQFGDLRDRNGADIGAMWDPANAALAALAVEVVANLLEKNPQALETLQDPQAGPASTASNPEDVEGRIEHLAAYSIYPQGLTDLSDINAPSFEVQVKWRGEHQGRSGGGWSVSRGPFDLLASSATSEEPRWDVPERFRRWQYRFATFEDALAAARAVVDLVKVNGRTWAQWREIEAERRP